MIRFWEQSDAMSGSWNFIKVWHSIVLGQTCFAQPFQGSLLSEFSVEAEIGLIGAWMQICLLQYNKGKQYQITASDWLE